MHDLGGPIGRSASDAKLDRYRKAYAEHGLSRWAVETLDGDFLGPLARGEYRVRANRPGDAT